MFGNIILREVQTWQSRERMNQRMLLCTCRPSAFAHQSGRMPPLYLINSGKYATTEEKLQCHKQRHQLFLKLRAARFVYPLHGEHEHRLAQTACICSRNCIQGRRVRNECDANSIQNMSNAGFRRRQAVRLVGQPSPDETKVCTLLYRRLFPELQPFRGRSSKG